MSKKSKEKRKKRSVAGATARRRERAEKGHSDMFNLPKGTEMFSIESAGLKRIDVIPYTVGKGNPNADEGDFYWERTFFAHRNVGVNNEMVVCPARTAKQKCPICEYQAKLQRDPEADEDTVKALSPSKRMLLNVRNLKKDPDKVKVWHVSHWYFGKAVDEALEAAYEDHDDNMDNFCDPEGGHYLKCVAEKGYEGQGYNIARVDFVSRKEDLDEDILEQAVCLDESLVIKDYDELKEMFFAGADAETDEDADEDEDEKPKTKKSKKSKSKKEEVDEDEDEDLDEDLDEDEDEDEDEKPKSKKVKKTKKKAKEEDEDEEGDDDAEDWDEGGDEDEDGEDEDADDGWDEDEDLDDEDEDEEPKKKKSKKKSRK